MAKGNPNHDNKGKFSAGGNKSSSKPMNKKVDDNRRTTGGKLVLPKH